MDKLRIAIIGTGSIAAGGKSTDGRSSGGHGPALLNNANAQLWSVLSRDLGRAREFAARFAAASPNPAHTTLDSLLADPKLDAVIVATPDKLHAEQAIAIARSGKHILLEKPMATDAQSAADVLEACTKFGVVLALAYRFRWHAGHRALIATCHAGRFGKIRHVRALATFRAPDAGNWRAASEFGRFWGLGALGTHLIDLIRWTLLPEAGEVEEVSSLISRSCWKGPHDETAIGCFRFTNDATAELCSSVLFNSPSRFEIYGTEGWAVAEETFGRDAGGRIWTNDGPFEFSPINPFVAQLDDFVRAVRERAKPEVDGIEGQKNLLLMLRLIQENSGR